MKISSAILELVPGAKFGITDNDYSTIEWLDERDQPTEEEVNAKVQELTDAFTANEYQRLRKAEYDKLNQYEMMFDDQVNGTTTWVDAINAIKAQYPKPE